MEKKKHDFGGWATRFNIKCSDGRTIRKDAFKSQDGQTVPLVWNHNHKDADNVLGHALLENREDGVYAYCSLNDTDQGKNARALVIHGDVRSLSIYANQLKQNGGDVIHGAIREVSLVLAGANPGAYIETVMAHSDQNDEEAQIYNPSEDLELSHADEGDGSTENLKPEEKKVDNNQNTEKTVQDVVDSMSEEQKNVMYALIGEAIAEKEENEENKKQQEGSTTVKHNAFEGNGTGHENDEDFLTHDEFVAEMKSIIADAKKGGSMKDAFIAHGITNIDQLFPEAQAIANTPETISRDMDWVRKVMNAVRHSPFSRVKSTAINITADEARAKGYVKGDQKVSEVVVALKRVTTPQTIYKVQKMDRDDVIDITEFDVVAYLKQEMRAMLDEELARSILIGDGRAADADHKINPLNIRPILGDSSTYTVARILTRAAGVSDAAFAKSVITDIIKSRKEYKGSGNPWFLTTEDMLTNMLLIEDTNGRVIYDTIEKLTTALRVREIITVPVMDNLVRTDEGGTYDYTCLGLIVNLTDYNVGADKGGAVSFFDDFDIDYNKQEYLIETRCSGALIKPFSAISFELKSDHVAG